MVSADALHEFSPREREVLKMRFHDGLTQAEIAKRLGVSQVQVSRLLRRTLRKVQDKIDPDVVMSKPKRGPCCEQVARPVFSDYWVEAIARANWRVMWVCGSAPSIGTCKRRPASCEGCGPAALRCLSACAHVAPEPMWRLGA